MPSQYPPYSASRRSQESHHSHHSTHRHTRNNPRPFAPEQEGSHRWKDLKDHMVAASGEFVGTTLFLWFAFSAAQVSGVATDPLQRLLYISLTFGFSLLVNAWVFYRISGGLFNPAVVLGLCVTGNLPWLRGVLFLFPAELLGGMTAAALASCMFPGKLSVETTLTAGTSVVQGLFIEVFLTAFLVFTILMLAAEKHKATYIAPIGIGLALFVAEMTGVNFTGGSLNPTRSFGPSVVAHSFPHYHWIYWIGPFLGALLAGAYYKFVKYFNYEEANPGQDETKA